MTLAPLAVVMNAARTRMVEEQLVRRGIEAPHVLEAFRSVPREAFVPERLAEVAYEDGPLPIGDGQTISQPYVVALTIEALALRGGERVLEIGTGSGYAAALLGRVAGEVHTVERIAALADDAKARLAALGITNVHVTVGDGSLGLPAHAPFDAIAVAAAGPSVPESLREQLAIGGRLVMPVAKNGKQALVRVTRTARDAYDEERLADVSFVPLIGAQAYPRGAANARDADGARDPEAVVREHAEPLDLGRVAARIEAAGARAVLVGGAIDGSRELLRLRVRLTRELLSRGRYAFVAVEGDLADGERVDAHIRGDERHVDVPNYAFARSGDGQYRTREVAELVDELGAHGARFHGLDVYGTSEAIAVALEQIAEKDPERGRDARVRAGQVSPWRRRNGDLLEDLPELERPLVALLVATLADRVRTVEGTRAREAAIRAAEDGALYYRHLLRGSLDAWSIRTDAMGNMLRGLLADAGPAARAIVWAHDAHVADAAGTDTGVRGHRTLGQLARLAFDGAAYLVGLDAGEGEVLASRAWGERGERVPLRPAADGSHERLLEAAGLPAIALPIRGGGADLQTALRTPRPSRAIASVYVPERELVTHYLPVAPALAFDEILFVSETTPLEPSAPPVTCEPEASHPLR